MKKLIAILSSFVSVFSTASIVVACGTAKPQSGGGTGESQINTQLLNKVLSDDGIDVSSLNTNSTGSDILSLIKKAITNIETTAVDIKYENANEESIILCEGDNNFTVSFNVKGETLKFKVIVKNIKKIVTWDENHIFDVPGQGSCLFWSIASAYLIPVKNNDKKIKLRFEELFGKDQLKNLSHVQTLLKGYSLEDTTENKTFYKDEIVKELVTKIFRNKVVDNIELTLKEDHDGQKEVYKLNILNSENPTTINDYLKRNEKRINMCRTLWNNGDKSHAKLLY